MGNKLEIREGGTLGGCNLAVVLLCCSCCGAFFVLLHMCSMLTIDMDFNINTVVFFNIIFNKSYISAQSGVNLDDNLRTFLILILNVIYP